MGYFIEEARDHLNTLEQGLLNLQSTLEDPEMLNELFRAAHSVKGGAAMLGIDSIQQTSHRLEDCFKILKEHPVKVDQDIESLLLSCLDTLQELLGQLQTPFGLTEEKAREIMAGVEPVFAELGSRLTQMVAATGGVITPETQETWIAPEAAASASAPVQAEEESALQLIFQSDVPRQLRDMLQLFKQADTLERRQQLQEICSGLKRTGEQFDLRNWCDLLESARLAIASPENTYHTLAPIVIREIKQGQELVLAGRSADIAVSPALQELLPVTAVTGELSLDAMFAESPSGELDFSAIADSSTNQAPAAVSASDLDFHKATGDRPGPEVGMAELNSLADLFEGDVPDLDITWEQEEILGSTADEILSSLDLDAASDFSDDFADLLFEESTASSSSAEDDLSGFLQAAEQREETAAIADLDFDLGDDSAGLFDDLLEPVTVEPPSDLSQPSGDLGDLFAEIDAVDLEAETPSAVSQPAPELAALGSLFGEMPVDDEELMTDLNEDSSSPFDEAEDLLQDDFGASFEDGLGDLGLDEELEGLDLLTEAQSGDADKVAESELDFSATLLEEPGESSTTDEDFLDLGLEETAAIASPEDDLGNLFGSGLSQERTDQLGAAESSELANLFGGSAGESELTDNLFDGDAEAGDAFAEMSLDAFADSAEPAKAALSEVDETEAASASEDDFSGLDWDAAELDLAPESSAAEAEEAEGFADLADLTDDTPVDGTGLELTSPELAWDAIESENAAADAAIDQALGLESFDLEEDAWDTPPEEATAPEAALFSETSAPEADVFGESSEAIAADDWELSPDDTQEPALGLEADLFEQSTGASTASETGTGNDWETFFDSDQKGDRSPNTSNEIEDFFGTDISETSLEASALTDFASTENLLSEEPAQPAAEAAIELEEDLWADQAAQTEAAALLDDSFAEAPDLDLGLADLAGEPAPETAASLDMEGATEAIADDFDLGFAAEELTAPEATAGEEDLGLDSLEEPELGLDLADTSEEAGALDFDLGLEAPIAETPEVADDLDFGLAADASDSLEFAAAEATDELDFGLDLTEEPESLGFEAAEADVLDFDLEIGEPAEPSLETAIAADDLGFDLSAADEFDLGFEAAEDSGELGLDLGDTDEFDLGLETAEETSELDFDLAAEATDDLGLDFGETEAAADELDFGLEETEATSELSFEPEGSESLNFDLGAGESEDLGFDLGAGEEAGDLDFDLGLEEPVAETAEAADELDFGLDLAEESEALDFGAAETTAELDFGLDLTEEPESLAFDAAEESDEFDLGFELGGEAESLDFAAAETTDELDFGLDLAEEPGELSFETEAAADDLGFDLGAEESLSLDDDLGDLFGTEASEVGEGESSAMFDFELGEESAATADDFGLDGAVTSDGLIFGLDEGDADLTESLFGAEEADTFEGDLFGLESAEMGGIEADLSFDDDLLAIADEVPAFLADDTGAIAVTETLAPEEARELESLLAEESSLPLETGDRQVFDELAALLDDGTIAVPAIAAPHVTQIDIESDIDNEFADLEKLLEDADNTLGPSTKAARGPAPTLSRRPRGLVEQTMRVPVKHLDNLNNLVGELVVNRNSLEQDQERLRQFLDNLLYQVQQLSDVGQRMRDLYERSLLESSLLSSRRTHQIAPGSHKKGDSNAFHATGENFDALEMDRFTSFHTLSQEMIELIVRVREASSDIEYIVDETDQVTRSFRQVTTQLQEGLNRSRMVPFAQIADRLPRAVRDIAMKCGKQAELVIEGRDTLIDKMILEQLYDPMTHLVNNAITHGIEAPDVRKASGKAPTGRITVRAFHQGNQTVISVSDDGAGIPVDRVKAKAVERGLVTPVEAKQMSRLDVYDLLFHPGFSIRDKADDFAGRGIGMDVVRTSLNEIRGAINTDSTLGRGTNFTIRLPLTLSISKALCCISNHARIAFPMDGVEDMLDLPKDRIQTNAEGQPCILWRDTMLPFRPLTELLRHNRFLGRGSVYGGHQDDDIISIVVLRSAGTFIALQVDQVLGEQEIVIKQLEGPVPKPAGVAGATVLGDGRIMPIADVLELIDLALGRARRDVGGALWEEGDQVPVEPPVVKTEPTVLIVDDSITVRELLSMTFNKSGYRVEQARDGQEAWEKLRSGLPCDLVFCDIEMPRMDGLELLSRMQKDPSLNRLPIAMLTSRGADRHRQMAVQLGARGYFTKPYLEEALLDAAQRMLKGEVLVGSK